MITFDRGVSIATAALSREDKERGKDLAIAGLVTARQGLCGERWFKWIKWAKGC
jgi:hypothetical protein